MPRRAAGAILLSFLCLAVQAGETTAPGALDLLNRMSTAVKTANYRGVFVYAHAHQTDTFRIVHRGAPAPERERLISLSGTPREVIRNGDTVTSYQPEAGSVMVEQTRPRSFVVQLPGPAESVAGQYTLAVTGTERIAGRDAWVVNILPRDAWRYGYRIWVDQSAYLPLRTELRRQAGAPVEQILFTDLEVTATIDDADLEPGISGQGLTWYHGAAAESAPGQDGRWRAGWLPPGFMQARYDRRALVASGDPVDQIVYSDGMASVSVFVERMRGGAPVLGPTLLGGVSTFGALSRGHQITVVGEVPPATVQRIANSMVSE